MEFTFHFVTLWDLSLYYSIWTQLSFVLQVQMEHTLTTDCKIMDVMQKGMVSSIPDSQGGGIYTIAIIAYGDVPCSSHTLVSNPQVDNSW